MNEITEILLPKGFMNVSITDTNWVTADTNDSANWDELAFPLPDGEWVIHSINGKFLFIKRI